MTGEACAEMHLLIQADLDGELAPAEAAKVGTHLEVHRSICSAGHAKLASETSVLKATGGDGYAPGGYSAAIAAARAAGTPNTDAITRW